MSDDFVYVVIMSHVYYRLWKTKVVRRYPQNHLQRLRFVWISRIGVLLYSNVDLCWHYICSRRTFLLLLYSHSTCGFWNNKNSLLQKFFAPRGYTIFMLCWCWNRWNTSPLTDLQEKFWNLIMCNRYIFFPCVYVCVFGRNCFWKFHICHNNSNLVLQHHLLVKCFYIQ